MSYEINDKSLIDEATKHWAEAYPYCKNAIDFNDWSRYKMLGWELYKNQGVDCIIETGLDASDIALKSAFHHLE